MRFLRSLERHNRRDWFQQRKEIYRSLLQAPMEAFILAMAKDLRAIAPEIAATPKVSAYRIYRDTRFSANKAPYKTHVAAVFPHRQLGKHQGAGFYVHIAPDEVFAGGGLYMPEPADLEAVREHIAAGHRRFRAILASPRFRRLFGTLSGEQLTRIPRGFPRDHPAADWLRHKQFLASRPLEPRLATTAAFYPEVLATFKALRPLVQFLNEPIVARRETIL